MLNKTGDSLINEFAEDKLGLNKFGVPKTFEVNAKH